MFSVCSVPIFNALKTTNHTDTHRLVGAPLAGALLGSIGVAGVTLRLGVQTATCNRSVACDDCRFIGTKEYTMAHPIVSSELL